MTTAIAVVVGVSVLGLLMTLVRVAPWSRLRSPAEVVPAELVLAGDEAGVLCDVR